MNKLQRAIAVVEQIDYYTEDYKQEWIDKLTEHYNRRISNAYVLDQINELAEQYERNE